MEATSGMLQRPLGSAAEASTVESRSMASEPTSPSAGARRSHSFRLNFEQRVLLRALLVWLPSFVLATILLWRSNFSPLTRWTAVLVVGILALLSAFSVKTLVLRPLQTLSNMLAAMREEDYSVKARGGGHQDALSQLVLETN